jgi:hypothetical protein
MMLNDAGRLVKTVWNEIPGYYPGIDTDTFQIMPNHIHGIIVIVGAGSCACPDMAQCDNMEQSREDDGQPQGVAPTLSFSLPDVVHRFKTIFANILLIIPPSGNWIGKIHIMICG